MKGRFVSLTLQREAGDDLPCETGYGTVEKTMRATGTRCGAVSPEAQTGGRWL